MSLIQSTPMLPKVPASPSPIYVEGAVVMLAERVHEIPRYPTCFCSRHFRNTAVEIRTQPSTRQLEVIKRIGATLLKNESRILHAGVEEKRAAEKTCRC